MSAGLSALLIPDKCGHRALEETLADWREERARAESAFGRGGADVRALAGVMRVCAMTAGAGLVRADVWRCFAWTMIAGAIAAAAMGFVNTARFAASHPSHMLLMVPSGMVMLSGFAAAFGLGLPRSRRVPGLTLCALILATTAGLAGYVVPKTNEVFRQHFLAQFSGAGSHTARPAQLASGNAERSAAELLRQAMSDERGAARRALLRRLAVTVSPVALLLLGAAFRARSSEACAWRRVQVTGGLAASAIFIGAGLACAAIQEALAAPYGSRPQSLPWWAAIVVSLLVTLWLSRVRPSGFGAAGAVPRT